jgi:hypothetical protein
MSNMNPETNDTETWRAKMIERAANLEREAALTRVIALAEDPLDGIAVLSDLLAAMQGGRGPSEPPLPTSKFFRRVAAGLVEKLVAVGERLSEDERRRLGSVAPRFLESIAGGTPDVIAAVVDLLPWSADVIALWLQLHLRTIEARFAS